MPPLPPAIAQACSGLPETGFGPGHEVIAQGARGGKLFVLIEGSVRVARDKVDFASIDEPGAVFGEVPALLGTPVAASVITTSDSRFYVIEDAEALQRSNPDFTLHLAKVLALRVHLLTAYLADLKTQFADHDNHLGMVHEVLCGLCQHPHGEVRLGSDRLPDGRT